MARLAGRTAIVTGASRGLGKAIALAMAAEGAAVAVVARTEKVWNEKLPGTIGETVAEIEAAGGRAVAIRADLLQASDRIRLVEEARAAFGPVTILVNNAAFTVPGRPPEEGGSAKPQREAKAPKAEGQSKKAEWPGFMNTPLRGYQRHFEMLFAAYEVTQLVVEDMLKEGMGSIINISSGASRMPGEGPYPVRTAGMLPGYGGSKIALDHLTQCIAYELTGRNIAANALSPSGAIITPAVSYYAATFDDYAPDTDFAEAAVRLALVDPEVVTGKVIRHADVLNGSFRSEDAARRA